MNILEQLPYRGRGGVTRRIPWPEALGVLVAVLAVGAAGILIYQRLATTAPAVQTQTAAVQRGLMVNALNVRGSVVADRQSHVTFGMEGRIQEIRVAVGDNVKGGQVLAVLDTEDLQARVDAAQSNLRVAQVKLQQLKDGATPEDIAAAKAALDAARAKAEELSAGPPSLEVQSAQAAVDGAEAALAAANARLAQLMAGPNPADVAAAQQAVAAARAASVTAQTALAKLKATPTDTDRALAQLDLDRARQELLANQISRDAACGRGQGEPGCKAGNASVWAGELAVRQAELKLQALQAGPNPGDVAAAQSNVDSAGKAQAAAEARLQQVLAGATPADIQAARSAVKIAESNLRAAQARLEQAKLGAKASDVRSAQASVAAAAADLAAKTSPRASDLAVAEEGVRQAQVNVDLAAMALARAALKAPYDGIVTAISTAPGEHVFGYTPIMTILDPKGVHLEAKVDEGDLPKLVPGQQVEVALDALAGRKLTGRVAAVSPVTPAAPAGTPALPAPAAQQSPTVYVLSVNLDPTDAKLTSGMMAGLSVILERNEQALLVPNRAIRRQGQNQVVEVVTDGGSEIRTVHTGSSNDQFTQVLDGLSVGDRVLIR